MGLFSKSLKDALGAKKSIKIRGIQFVLKKIDPLDHAKGLKVMRSCYETYTVKSKGDTELTDGQLKKIRDHYRDVFMASVVKPKLSRKDEEDSVCVDDIFTDPELSEMLYMEIMYHTYGKKKLMLQLSAGLEQLSSTS